MSDAPEGANWWQASDGKWYPPESWTGPSTSEPPAVTGPASNATGPDGLPWYRKMSVLIAAGVGLFLVGLAVGVISARQGDDTASAGKPPSAPTSDGKPAPATTAKPPRPTTTAEPLPPAPTDFVIGIIETERSCFGSAGCNISYRIDPQYIGATPLSPGRSYTVIYEVRGGESLATKNFELQGERASFSEDFISTPPDPVLTAVPVRVLEN